MKAPDRLQLIEARWHERGRPDGDFAWLLAECKRLRAQGNVLRNVFERIEAIVERAR